MTSASGAGTELPRAPGTGAGPGLPRLPPAALFDTPINRKGRKRGSAASVLMGKAELDTRAAGRPCPCPAVNS